MHTTRALAEIPHTTADALAASTNSHTTATDTQATLIIAIIAGIGVSLAFLREGQFETSAKDHGNSFVCLSLLFFATTLSALAVKWMTQVVCESTSSKPSRRLILVAWMISVISITLALAFFTVTIIADNRAIGWIIFGIVIVTGVLAMLTVLHLSFRPQTPNTASFDESHLTSVMLPEKFGFGDHRRAYLRKHQATAEPYTAASELPLERDVFGIGNGPPRYILHDDGIREGLILRHDI